MDVVVGLRVALSDGRMGVIARATVHGDRPVYRLEYDTSGSGNYVDFRSAVYIEADDEYAGGIGFLQWLESQEEEQANREQQRKLEQQRLEREREESRLARERADARRRELAEQEAQERRREAEQNRQIDEKYGLVQGDALAWARDVANRLGNGQVPNDTEINGLRTAGQIGLIGHIWFARFDMSGSYWDAAQASSAWRSARLPRNSIEAFVPIVRKEQRQSRELAGLLTSLGGAFRDIGELTDAEAYANQALVMGIRLRRETYHPHNLLGAICLQTDRIAEGERHFSRAIELDATSKDIEGYFSSAFEQFDDERQIAAAEYFLEQDAKKYYWAAKYVSSGSPSGDDLPF